MRELNKHIESLTSLAYPQSHTDATGQHPAHHPLNLPHLKLCAKSHETLWIQKILWDGSSSGGRKRLCSFLEMYSHSSLQPAQSQISTTSYSFGNELPIVFMSSLASCNISGGLQQKSAWKTCAMIWYLTLLEQKIWISHCRSFWAGGTRSCSLEAKSNVTCDCERQWTVEGNFPFLWSAKS